MNLREYQAKTVFAEHGMAVPDGKTATTPAEVGDIARSLDSPVVLKPQLGVKKRGKLGLISFCDDPDGAEQEAGRLFDLTIEGERIRTLLVEAKADITEELYLAVTIDLCQRCPVLMISRQGGVEIEELSKSDPEKILKLPIDILCGITDDEISTISEFVDPEVASLASTLYSVFRTYDAELLEVNPLIRTNDGSLVAVDAVLNINDAALFRQAKMESFRTEAAAGDPIADEASANRWTYIDLPGDIAILSSGAGLTMAILDLIKLAGGSAANFLDTAQIDDTGIYEAFGLLTRAKETRATLVNIFAGLNRCDRLAEGIVRYLDEHPYDRPVVVRMIGNKEEDGHDILRGSGIEPYRNLEDAVERVVVLAREG